MIYDESNVTKTNLFKEIGKMVVTIAFTVAVVYFAIFALSGIVIKSLSIDKQIALENWLSFNSGEKIKSDNANFKRLKDIRDKIKSSDKNYPKTTNLNIVIINDKEMNVMCLPNGTIYITSSLYEKLKDDEALAFVIAHEMAHYKNKDHLMALRRNIASSFVVICFSLISQDKRIADITENIIDSSDLHHSRIQEAKADNFAAKSLIKLYGDVDGGIKALNILDEQKQYTLELVSTHPSIKNRIKKLKNAEKKEFLSQGKM